jgi:hypothetical protein
MTTSFPEQTEEHWVPYGVVQVSAAALQFAREFGATVDRSQSGAWVTAFSWATEISVKRDANGVYEDIGAGLTLGAFKRHEVPARFLQTQDGLEFVIQIPEAVWRQSARRLIDLDEALLFKLALR